MNDLSQLIAFAAAETKYSDALEVPAEAGKVEVVVDIDAIAGVGASLVVTGQVSADKVNWIDREATAGLTATGVTELTITKPLAFFRLKGVLSGTTPTATVRLAAVPTTQDEAQLPSGAATAAHQVTQNTKLDSVIAAVDGVETKLDSVIAAVDGVETKLDSVVAAVDGLEASVDGVEAELTNIKNALNLTGKTLKTAKFTLTATGTVVSAVASKRIKVFAIKLVVSAAISVKWRSGASTDLEELQSLAANGGYTEAVNPPAFLLASVAGESLDLVISGTGTAAGRVTYWDDDAS